MEESSTHCHQFFPSTRAEVSSEATTLLLRTSAATVSAAAASGVPARASILAIAPLADADAEHLVEQPHQPLEADRLGDVQMQDERDQPGAKRRARRHPARRRRAEAAAAA